MDRTKPAPPPSCLGDDPRSPANHHLEVHLEEELDLFGVRIEIRIALTDQVFYGRAVHIGDRLVDQREATFTVLGVYGQVLPRRGPPRLRKPFGPSFSKEFSAVIK